MGSAAVELTADDLAGNRRSHVADNGGRPSLLVGSFSGLKVEMSYEQEVVVVIGVGGIGQAIARRQGAGKTVLLADINEDTLASRCRRTAINGAIPSRHNVLMQIRTRIRFAALANSAAGLGASPR